MTATNPNLEIFDKAVVLIESTPRQSKVLHSGEVLSYRVYNPGRTHTLVMIPGYCTDDILFSPIAVLPEFKDHTIIAVNPRGWHGSSMNTSTVSHEVYADDIMELLKLMGIEKTMVGGYSTGGGIAFHLAHKNPNIITHCFMIHSIALNGFHLLNEHGKTTSPNDVAAYFAAAWPDDLTAESLLEVFKMISSNVPGLPPVLHPIMTYIHPAVVMKAKKECMMANVLFNATPIKSTYAEPSDALEKLKSKVIVIHGSLDTPVSPSQVEHVTKLAIAEKWASPDLLSYYDDGQNHMFFYDNPTAFAATYRKAFEEQVLSTKAEAEADKSLEHIVAEEESAYVESQ